MKIMDTEITTLYVLEVCGIPHYFQTECDRSYEFNKHYYSYNDPDIKLYEINMKDIIIIQKV